MEAGGLFMVAVITAVAGIATQHTPFRVWRHAPLEKF